MKKLLSKITELFNSSEPTVTLFGKKYTARDLVNIKYGDVVAPIKLDCEYTDYICDCFSVEPFKEYEWIFVNNMGQRESAFIKHYYKRHYYELINNE